MKRMSRYPRRTAAVTLELIVGLPVFLIFLAGIIEFGLIQANSQQVSQSSRLGAKLAAEFPNLDPGNTAAAAAQIRLEVDRQLQNAGLGLTGSDGVTLRHTVAGGGEATNGTCSDPLFPSMPFSAVRVTVRVPLPNMTPNLLNVFGFSIAGRTVEFTATYAYEL